MKLAALMRRATGIALAAAAAVTSVHAAQAWSLWERDGDGLRDGAAARWQRTKHPVFGFYEECARARNALIENFATLRDGGHFRVHGATIYVTPGGRAGGRVRSVEYVCLPEGVDPRRW